MMKSAVRIGSMFLVGYFLALPILFALHAHDHDHVISYEQETQIHESFDCELCHLIKLQVLSVEQTDLTISFVFNADSFGLKSYAYQFGNAFTIRLRGPPLG